MTLTENRKSNPRDEYFQQGFPVDILDRLWTSDWVEVADLELIPGCPMRDDKWVLPHDWASKGQRQSVSRRTVDFCRSLPPGLDRSDEHAEALIRRQKRLAGLLFTQTLRLNEQTRGPPSPSSWVRMVQRLNQAALKAHPLSKQSSSTCPDGYNIFEQLKPEQLRKLLKGAADQLSSSIPRLNALYRLGLWDDWPAGDVFIEGNKKKGVWRPFNDDFIALAGHAAVWLSETLGPEILGAWRHIRAMQSTREAISNPKVEKAKQLAFAQDWGKNLAERGVKLEYYFSVTRIWPANKAGILSDWSQITPVAIRDLAFTLQEAHAWVINMATAPRNGEVVSLPRDCLRFISHGSLLRGDTFKLSDTDETRDWPLPRIAVSTIRQQEELAEILDPGGDRLFVSFKLGKGRRKARDKLKFDASALPRRIRTTDGRELSERCEGNVHSHRFRMTLARLAALTLVGATEILYDILGHRDPDMTVGYILSDPELQTEMRVIAKEAAIMIAKDAANDNGMLGGRAAKNVNELVGRYQASSAEKEMDETSLLVVAKLLSQNGRVMLVKRNVLCTKTEKQAGPCNRRIGTPDIGNCSVGCLHRLELAAAKQDHLNALEQALGAVKSAEGMIRAWWQGQIIGHLLPFPEIAREALAREDVRDALRGLDLDRLFEDHGFSPTDEVRALLKSAA